MKRIQSKILLSFLLLASHKANSMSVDWNEEVAILTGADPDPVMTESRRRTAELNEIIPTQNVQTTEPHASVSTENNSSLSTAAATTSNIQDDSTTPPAPADAPSAAASSTTAANPETYDLKGWGWESTTPADKAPCDDNGDGAQLSTDNSKDVFAPADDVATDDNNNAEGPLPSRPAPTDDDDISDIVSIHSDSDDSEPAATTTSSAAPSTAAASTLPTEYAFVTAGDSSQRADAALLACAQNVLKGVNNCITVFGDPCPRGALMEDALDAQALVNWATVLQKKSVESGHFIIMPKSVLDKALARLKELEDAYCSTNSTFKAETNYTNPKGMGSIETFDMLALAPTNAPQTAASSTTAHPLTDDNNDNDDSSNADDDDSNESSSWSPDLWTVEGTENLEGINNTEMFATYANQVAAAILKTTDYPAADYNDAHAICQWAESMHKNSCKFENPLGVPSKRLDHVLNRLHELARKYHKENRWVKASNSAQFKASGIVFKRDINITPANTTETPKATLPKPAAAASSVHKDSDDDDNYSSSSGDDTESKTGSGAQGDKKQKADSKIQSDGSTSDDDDDTSSLSSEDDSTGKEPQKYPYDKKTPPAITSSFTGNVLKLVKNKLVLTGGAVAAAIWYWQYYYAQDEDGAYQPV